MAHAANPDAVKSALRLGAHTVEHGYIMDEECIGTLSESPTWYVPTLAISHLTEGQATNDYEKRWLSERNIAHELQCRADAAADEHAHWFKRALDSGAKMALGSDIRPLKDAALLEMGLWVRDGATTWQTLQAATRNAAELCRVGDRLGTVEVGKIADLIVVSANPLDDINNLRQLELVIKNGHIVSDKTKVEHPGLNPVHHNPLKSPVIGGKDADRHACRFSHTAASRYLTSRTGGQNQLPSHRLPG